MSKFTKGKWWVELSTFGSIESASLYYQHGFFTSTNVIDVDETRLAGESWIDMRRRTESQRRANEQESIANLHLMSAAQNMHEALVDVANSNFGKTDNGSVMVTLSQETADKIISALAKADGKGEEHE
jgi:hypothetical protein